jgi:plastocyanin
MQDTKVECKSTVEVAIALEGGMVQCTPDCVYAHRGQTIEWKCQEDFPIAIHLGYDSPFDRVHHQATRKQSIRLKITNDTRRGRYKYVVAVFDGEKVWIEDPQLIVLP